MKRYSLAILFAWILCPLCAGADAPEKKQYKYSMEESLLHARNAYDWPGLTTMTPNRLKELSGSHDPDVRKDLYKRLNDSKEDVNTRKGAAVFLGVIGQKEDVEKFETWIKKICVSEISDDNQSVIVGIMWALSTMDRRGIPEARRKLNEMTDPEYWESLHYPYDREKPVGWGSPALFARAAFASKVITEDPDFPKLARDILEKVNKSNRDQRVKELFANRHQIMLDEHRKYNESMRTGDWSIYYGKKWDAMHGKKEKKPKAERPSSRKYSQAFQNKPLTIALDKAVETALAQEAFEAYQKAADALLKGDLEYLACHLADDCRPVFLPAEQTAENLKKFLADKEFVEGLGMLKILVEELNQRKFKPGVTQVRCYNFSGRLTEGVAADQVSARPRQHADVVVVLIGCAGGEGMQKKYPKLIQDGSGVMPTVVDEKGAPVIQMVWERNAPDSGAEGQWYWNPFGF
jgi:hypothetical protein